MYQEMSGYIKCGVHIQRNKSRLKNERNSDTAYNMDEPWGPYAKGNKLVTKSQIPFDSTYRRYLVRGVGSCLMGMQFQFCKMERDLEIVQ